MSELGPWKAKRRSTSFEDRPVSGLVSRVWRRLERDVDPISTAV